MHTHAGEESKTGWAIARPGGRVRAVLASLALRGHVPLRHQILHEHSEGVNAFAGLAGEDIGGLCRARQRLALASATHHRLGSRRQSQMHAATAWAASAGYPSAPPAADLAATSYATTAVAAAAADSAPAAAAAVTAAITARVGQPHERKRLGRRMLPPCASTLGLLPIDLLWLVSQAPGLQRALQLPLPVPTTASSTVSSKPSSSPAHLSSTHRLPKASVGVVAEGALNGNCGAKWEHERALLTRFVPT
eukprot:COSAG05_NODE_3722_length_1882_cov_4.042064_1_plen_250_part_00